MDSFASQDRVYDDGQENKVAIPEEIQQFGFKPPVRLASGELTVGDSLTANHLNFLLNDLYSKAGRTRQVVKVSHGQNGYILYDNNDRLCWGLATTAGDNGVAAVQFPTNMFGIPQMIQFTQIGADSSTDLCVTHLMPETVTQLGFSAINMRLTKEGVLAPSKFNFFYRAEYISGTI